MKKRDLAGLTFRAKQLEQLNTHSLECLVEVIQTSFSVLATADPNLAIIVIDQLYSQKQGISEFLAGREKDEKEYISMVSAGMPDSMVFDEDDSEDEGLI